MADLTGAVFICHASRDAAGADQVVAALEANGVACWIAPRNIRAGQNYTEAILDALASTPLLVLVFSAAANESSHVERELDVAVGSHTRILPVRIDASPPSPALRYFIGTSQWLDAQGRQPEEWGPVLAGAAAATLGLEPAGGASNPPPPPPPPTAEAPLVLGGRWEMTREIARGSQSVVIAVRDLDGVLPVCAAKVGPPSVSTDELGSLIRLHHQHVMPYRDAGTIEAAGLARLAPPGWFPSQTGMWLVTDLAARSLRDEIGEHEGVAHRPLGPDDATRLAAQVFGALAYLHANQVVHGDVKPANVLQVERIDGTEWRLADFGISSALDPDRTSVPLKGLSVRWADPDSRVTSRLRPSHDVYSAALTVHVAATGALPDLSPGAPRAATSLSEPLRSVLGRALGPPDARPDAAEAAALLTRSPQPVGAVGAPSPHDEPTVGDATPAPPLDRTEVAGPAPLPPAPVRRRRRVGLVVAGLVAVAALGAGAALARSGSGGSGPTGEAAADPAGAEDGAGVPVEADDGATSGTAPAATGAPGGIAYATSGGQVVVADLDTGDETPVESGLTDVSEVTTSADGSVIAVRGLDEGQGAIAIGDGDGDGAFRTLNLDGDVRDPALSPDGQQLAYTRTVGNDTGVVVVPVAGGDPTEVAASSAEESEPAWAPDGDRLALLRQVSDGQAVVTTSATTGAVEATLASGGLKRSPAWSPDGGSLAWVGRRNERWEPFLLASLDDGAEATLLSTDGEETALTFDGAGDLVVAQNRSGLAVVDVANGEVESLPAAGDVVGLASFSA